jgi:alkanesulfonate monooxygenase SsuD/methylene tetrahydromethanopterin reductase-like flavin-dependent oxidoreductase (luciferase family)
MTTRKFFFFSEMGYNAYPIEEIEKYGYSALMLPNHIFDRQKASELWQMFLREHEFACEMGFDGSVCNEHHNNVLSMQESVNISAAVVSQRISGTVALIGNPLPIHDNPVRVAEEIAMLDLISGGRIISGFVRGTGVEQLSTNANPAYNRERFEEAYQLILQCWTRPGPFRWEGKHYHLRVVNPWQLPLQKPHPPIWAAGILSPETIRWAAKQRITYLVLGSALDATAQCREIYHEVAAADGWTPGPQHLGYLIHTACMDTDDEAFEVGKYHYGGASVIGRSGGVAQSAQSALTGGTGSAGVTSGGPHPEWMAPPGYMSKQARTGNMARERRMSEGSYEAATRAGLIVTGSPKTLIQKFKHIIDRTDPGYLTFWAREGKKPHAATMRGIELLGREVIPALREHVSALVTGKEPTPWPN